jgi:hypothetical protein
MKNRPSKKQTKLHSPSPLLLSLLSMPFPVFVTDASGKVVPTITLPEFGQLVGARVRV